MALLHTPDPAPGQDKFSVLYADLIAAIQTINNVLGGGAGTNGKITIKASDDNFDFEYIDLGISGGDAFKFLRKASATGYDFEYVNAIEVEDAVRVASNKVTLGSWNMDSTSSITVAHGLSSVQWKKIRNIFIYIRNDNDDAYYTNGRTAGGGGVGMGVQEIDDTNITIVRETGGFFDGSAFNDPGFDRGYMVIEYEV